MSTTYRVQPPHLLRRCDDRRRVRCYATVHCHGVFQKVALIDFSAAGLRLDETFGLTIGDRVMIELLPDALVKGRITWSVGRKVGVRLSEPLASSVYTYLADLAARMSESEGVA